MVNPDIKDYGFGGKFRTKEEDDEYRAKAKGVPKWTKERCIIRINEILDRLDKLLLETEKVENKPDKLKLENIRDLKIMMNTLLDYLKYIYPPIQTNLNVNVEYKSAIDFMLESATDEFLKQKGIIIIKDEKNEN